MRPMPTLITNPDGSIRGVNRSKLFASPYILRQNPPNAGVTMAANGTSNALTVGVSDDGLVHVDRLALQRTGTCKVMMQLQDGAGITPLSNAALHADCVFGTISEPYVLPEALCLSKSRQLICRFSDLSGSSNTAWPNFIGDKFSHGIGALGSNDTTDSIKRVCQRLMRKQRLSIPYFYTNDNGIINVGGGAYSAFTANAQVDIVINQDHGFEIHQISFVATQAFTFDLIHVETGESIINAPGGTHYEITNTVGAGSGSYPMKFPEPYFIPARNKLLLSVTNLNLAVDNSVYIVLGGAAINEKLEWR